MLEAAAEPLLREIKETGIASLALPAGVSSRCGAGGYQKDCVGFHSEYYLDLGWREGTSARLDTAVTRGYTKYSQYKGKIYFFEALEDEGYVISYCMNDERSCVTAKLHPKRPLDNYRNCNWEECEEWEPWDQPYAHTYLAVNRQGYFLYNTKIITLFRFDGSEVYTLEFCDKGDEGDKYHVSGLEGIYIYDDMVIYSETEPKGSSFRIWRVHMLEGEKELLWETFRGDLGFDEMLRKSYALEWGRDLPFSVTSTDVESCECPFLYANHRRVIAGYRRWHVDGKAYISCIICIDLEKRSCSILDCFACAYDREDSGVFPSIYDRLIVAFDMRNDSMWVQKKENSKKRRLYRSDIKRVTELEGDGSVKWELDWSSTRNYGERGFYYFDGNRCFFNYDSLYGGVEGRKVARYSIGEDGVAFCKKGTYDFPLYFWCFGDTFIVPNKSKCEWDGVNRWMGWRYGGLAGTDFCLYDGDYIDGDVKGKDQSYSEIYCLSREEIMELLREAKDSQ